MSAVAQHDYVMRVQEEVRDLEKEMNEPGVRDGLTRVTERLGLPADLATAAIFRAARRSGLTMRLMLTEINGQLDRAARPGA